MQFFPVDARPGDETVYTAGVPFSLHPKGDGSFIPYPMTTVYLDEPRVAQTIHFAGMVTVAPGGCEWWGQNEACYNQAERVYIGDRLADIFIEYTDGTGELIPLYFGLNVWNYDLFCHSPANEPGIQRWGGPFREPFDSDPAAKALLDDSLCLTENDDPTATKSSHYMFSYRPLAKPIRSFLLRELNMRRAGVWIAGITLCDGQPDVRTVDRYFFRGRTYLNRLDRLARRLYQFADELPDAVAHTRPEDSTAPVVDFCGCGAADRYSNVYAYNIYDAATAKVTADGRPHTSSEGAPSFGSYLGFGTFHGNHSTYTTQIWTRDVGRTLIELAKAGQNERLLLAADILHHYLYSDLPRFPRHHWKRVANCHEQPDGFRDSLDGRENDGHASVMQFMYQLFETGVADSTWCEQNRTALTDAAEWFMWQMENPEESDFDGVLFSESEASTQSHGNYDVFSNAIAYYALRGYARMAAQCGWVAEAARWEAGATTLRRGIEEAFFFEHDRLGTICTQEYFDCWTYGYQRFAPLFFMSDLDGYDPERIDPAWTQVMRNTYLHQKEEYFNPASGREMGYGQGYLTETALLLDEYDDFTACVEATANFCYHHSDETGYIVPECIIMHPSGRFWFRNADHGNGVQQGETLKAARLVLGLDDLQPEVGLRLIPRLPLTFDGMQVKGQPVCTVQNGVHVTVPVDYAYNREGEGYRLQLTASQPIKIASVRIGPFDTACTQFTVKGAAGYTLRDIAGRRFAEVAIDTSVTALEITVVPQ